MHPYPEIDEQEYRARNRQFGRLLIFALCVIGLFAFCVVMASCSAEKRITRIAAKHPGSIIKPCSIFLAPIIQTDSVKIIFKDGIPIVSHDTSVVHDTANNVVYKTIRTNTLVHDTVEVNHTTVKVDNVRLNGEIQKREAAEAAWQKEHDGRLKAEAETKQQKDAKGDWRKWCLIFGAVVLVGIVWKVYGLLSGGLITGLFKK